MKKIIVPLAAAVLALGIAGCGSNDTATPAGEASQTTQAAPNLEGTWKQKNSKSEDSYQEAVIKGDNITINWITDNGDTKSLYWTGTFKAPTSDGEYTWESKGDTEQMSKAILASQDDAKKFTYKDGEISYEASIMGTTTTVRMEQQK